MRAISLNKQYNESSSLAMVMLFEMPLMAEVYLQAR